MGRIRRILNALPSRVNRIPAVTRRRVLEKYNYKCAGNIPGVPCNYSIIDALEIDHILPKSIKSINRRFNLQVLCSNCHALKTKRYDIKLIQKHKRGHLTRSHIKHHIRRFIQ
jgi:5-methylcytosine-specific restriction endonuclease McrA